jgi:ribose transport system ATP-binding protein
MLRLEDIEKSFGGVRALRGVSLEFKTGTINGLVGPNGAGKSTLIGVVSGAIRPDAGRLFLDGNPTSFSHPIEAQTKGISVVPQELSAIPEMSVEANISLGTEIVRCGFIQRRQTRERANQILQRLGVDVNARTLVEKLTPAEQRIVMIAQGLYRKATILLLDEPTAALTVEDAARVIEVIRALPSEGMTVVYVSHRLDEVVDLCDEVSVMRDGRKVESYSRAVVSVGLLVKAISSEQAKDNTAMSASPPEGHDRGTPWDRKAPDVVLRCRNLTGKSVRGADVIARAGEIIGILGLPGSGADEVLAILTGRARKIAGSIEIGGSPVAPRSPADALKAGISVLVANRSDAAVLDLSVRENIVLSSLAKVGRHGILTRRRASSTSRSIAEKVGLALRVDDPIATLSGGNQQRVLLARTILVGGDVIVLEDPTRGVDVRARAVLHDIIREVASDGKVVVMSSSEYEELIGLACRLYIFAGGCLRSVLNGDEISPQSILEAVAHSGH